MLKITEMKALSTMAKYFSILLLVALITACNSGGSEADPWSMKPARDP